VEEMNASGFKTAPFSWQEKRVLRRIREGVEDYASALGVYLALSVVASDKESEEFQTTYTWLSSLSGFSVRTVQSRIHDLATLGVIGVKVHRLKSPATYRLLPFGNGCLSLSNGCRTLGNGETPQLLTSEEKKKGIGRKPTPGGNGTADRITLEKKLKIQQGRYSKLASETAEPWQRNQHPELVIEKKALESEITVLENQLLEA
jgi:hypothetical protein